MCHSHSVTCATPPLLHVPLPLTYMFHSPSLTCLAMLLYLQLLHQALTQWVHTRQKAGKEDAFPTKTADRQHL